MKLTLILKGNSPRRSQFLKTLDSLRAGLPGADLTLLETRFAGHAVELAAQATGTCDYLIAVGGDGTINEMINGCLQVQEQSPATALPVFGILAYGTANDMARSLGLRGDIDELLALLRIGTTACIDAGRVYYTDADGRQARRFFLNAVDVGVGAEAVQHLNRQPRLLGRNLHYLRAVLKTLASYRPRELHAVSDQGLDWRGQTLAIVAANGRYLGSGLCLAPGASLDDGLLAVTVVTGDAGRTEFVRNLRRLRRGELIVHPAAQYHQARRLEVSHLDAPAPVEADGEFLGHTPVAVEILPCAVHMLHPEGVDPEYGG